MLLSMSQWPPFTLEEVSACPNEFLSIPESNSPLDVSYIVVITAGADTIDNEGADLLDAGKLGTTHDGVWKNGKRHE